ncbi:hypothetical protein, conserved [Eimeria praecox]|uniref:Uncharacterized protein n=1 Tax=Eimeria praecox TaxID=51316 RepID=U6GLB5_9EIME|nr:hypothetical protein, conserved [Eimeria praecox]
MQDESGQGKQNHFFFCLPLFGICCIPAEEHRGELMKLLTDSLDVVDPHLPAEEHRGELMKLLTDSLDVVDPHHFLRLSKACSERLAAQDEVGDGMPQSIMGDYTVGAELLRSHHGDETSQHSSRPAGEDPQNNFHSADPLGEEYQNIQREIATRPPTPTRLTEKRIGEFVVDWQDPSIPEPGSRSKNLVFLSNLPHAPRHVLTDILCKAFSGCGKIQRLEIFDDRLRTLDQTEDNTLQEKGEQAIRDKLERRFSPICALAEFSSTQEKQNACSTYLRTFGVPCIDRLVYPEDAAVKTTLIATNLPFILTPDEIARILSFALVHDAEASSHYPGVCRIRMTNPKLFGYEQLFVEARSDAEEPFFLLPLHRKLSNTDVAVRASGPECANDRNDKLQSSRKIRKNSPSTLRTSLESDASENLPNKASSVSVDFGKHVLQDKWAGADSSNGYGEYLDVVSAAADESIFIPSIIGLQTEASLESS